MDAIEGRRDGGKLDNGRYSHEGGEDSTTSLLDLVRTDSGWWEDREGNEFDGIRSEVDFRRAMALAAQAPTKSM
jgi:hypothetical protein